MEQEPKNGEWEEREENKKRRRKEKKREGRRFSGGRKKKRRERERSVKNRGIGEEGFAPFCFIFVGVTDLNILMLNS